MRNWGMPPSGSTSGSGPPFKESVDSPSSIRQVLSLVARLFCPDFGQDCRKSTAGSTRTEGANSLAATTMAECL